MTATIVSFIPEYRATGFALPTGTPRLSWVFEDSRDSVTQLGYELELQRTGGIESTGRIDTGDQVFVDWPFAALASRERAVVRVRVWTSEKPSDWSEPLALEASLLEATDWTESFVSPSLSAPPEGVRPGYLMRADFEAHDVASARLYSTAHGIYVAHLNGIPVSDEELAPGWTSYQHRLRFQTVDVTHLLTSGQNSIGIELSDGWYRGRIGFHGGVWDNYGSDLAALVQLELTLRDGTVRTVDLSNAWKWSSGPVVAASLYDGEHYDARLLPEGWSSPGFDDSQWNAAHVIERGEFRAALEPAVGPPVRVIETLHPVTIEHRANGRIRLDFGQNIAGRLSISATGRAGETVRLHHAEVLEDDELATRPLRGAPSIDSYTFANEHPVTWSPTFTIHGFRYAELEGWVGEFDSRSVTAQVMHSDMRRRGWFSSDHELLNRLHENTVWSMRDNFVDLPTDCPQRDERLGWTGDIQVFAPAASFLYASDGVLASWLRDVAVEQGENGAVPNFVPWIECGFPRPSSAAWGDAAVIVPWTMYERNGDCGILDAQYESMTKWVEHSASKRTPDGLIRAGMQLGDWLDPAAPPEDPGAGITDAYLVANAYLFHSTNLVAKVSHVLGRSVEAVRYRALASSTRDAFRAAYLRDGLVVDPTPTALSLALVFGLLDAAEVSDAGDRLAELVRDGGYRVSTGFVGTPLICDALTIGGHVETAYRLLLETECPSWLYPVTMGATTIWERWDSLLPDGSVNPGEMTSFNHYALGAVVDFLHRVTAGIAPGAPGYRHIIFQPRPTLALGRAEASLDTPYGFAAAHWYREGDTVEFEAVVPSGATGTVRLPDGQTHEVGSGTHRFSFLTERETVEAV